MGSRGRNQGSRMAREAGGPVGPRLLSTHESLPERCLDLRVAVGPGKAQREVANWLRESAWPRFSLKNAAASPRLTEGWQFGVQE